MLSSRKSGYCLGRQAVALPVRTQSRLLPPLRPALTRLLHEYCLSDSSARQRHQSGQSHTLEPATTSSALDNDQDGSNGVFHGRRAGTSACLGNDEGSVSKIWKVVRGHSQSCLERVHDWEQERFHEIRCGSIALGLIALIDIALAVTGKCSRHPISLLAGIASVELNVTTFCYQYLIEELFVRRQTEQSRLESRLRWPLKKTICALIELIVLGCNIASLSPTKQPTGTALVAIGVAWSSIGILRQIHKGRRERQAKGYETLGARQV